MQIPFQYKSQNDLHSVIFFIQRVHIQLSTNTKTNMGNFVHVVLDREIRTKELFINRYT